MNIIEILEAIEAAPKGSARNGKMAELVTPELRQILMWSMSPYITFGVKQLPDPDEEEFLLFSGDGLWYPHLADLLNELANRTLSGNAAQDAIRTFLGRRDRTTRKWTERIIRQNLKLGIDAKTVNKFLGAGTIPVFEVPLATSHEDVKGFPGADRWLVQPKMDGGRCVAMMSAQGGPVTLLSRNGKVWENFESIRKSLQEWNTRLNLDKDWVLDGEVISRLHGRIDFQAIQATMHAKVRKTEIGELEYVIFDSAPQCDWAAQRRQYESGLRNALGLLAVTPPKNISVILTVDSEHLDLDPAKIAENFVTAGFEGAIYRKAQAPVRLKRTKDIIKVKLFSDDEAEIIGFEEGTEKNVGKLGAFLLKHKNGKTFKVGSGFSDQERGLYWQDKNLLGKLCAFKFFRLTDDSIPYLPTFRGIRHSDDV